MTLLEKTRVAVNGYFKKRLASVSYREGLSIEAKRCEAIRNLGLDPYFTPTDDKEPLIISSIYGE